MTPTIESQYKDLLIPIKDPEKSFTIDISQLLYGFVRELLSGKTTANFNSAALIIQGSASLYGKKVEYVYTLADRLHNCLQKQKSNDQPQQNKKDSTKEKEKKEDRLKDPFLSTEIKLGKNLSCLKKKNNPRASTKSTAKKIKSSNAPVHLLTNDNDEKGDVFYDTRGEVVGNKGDFAINKCCLINSGWLLLPTVNPSLIPDYYDDSDDSPPSTEYHETGDDFEPVHSSTDDGFGSCVPSSDIQQFTPGTESNSQETNTNSSSAVPMSVDEGIGDPPNLDSPGAENVPAYDGEEDPEDFAPEPVRQSVRHALKPCQLVVEDDPLTCVGMKKGLLKRRDIEKKNVIRLPSKLRKNCPPTSEESIIVYCVKNFFSPDVKVIQKLLRFDTESFDQNNNMLTRLTKRIDLLKRFSKTDENISLYEEERESDEEDVEVSRGANEDNDTVCVQFNDDDFHIEQDDNQIILPENPGIALPKGDNAGAVPAVDVPSPDISHIAHAENENYMKEVQQFVQNSEITERVLEWEKSVKPFLGVMETRGSFDINLYGSQILNSFEDNNRKQTKTFREICKNKEKWEIHRYFMAVLPLANIGNVELKKEKKPDGTEEIFVTLLSRKMHHKELEEFGHNNGEHS